MKKNFLLILLVTFFQATFAQKSEWSISGDVFNATSKKPLAFASVFISNSSKGTFTDSLGHFFLKGLEAGNYNLVISYVGFESQIYPTGISGKNSKVSIAMADTATKLEDVVINLKNNNRKEEIKLFRKTFLGTDKNAKKTDILNEDKIRLHTDKSGKVLSAHSDEIFIIVNNALGYNIKYLLKEFSYNKKTGDLHYIGYPLFVEMKNTSPEQLNQWKENRAKIYESSLLRFYRTLGKRSLLKQGYVLGDLTIPQMQASRAAGVAAKPDIPPNGFSIRVGDQQYIDTLFYPEIPYYKLISALPGGKYLLNFTGMLSVDVTNAQGKVANIDYYKPGEKTSIISLKQPVEVNENGLPQDPSLVSYIGYWIDLRVADLLPFDYKPEDK